MRYLDAVSLAKLRNLRIDLRRHRAEGTLSGRHRSLHQGFSQEFAHHRQYAPGDELKFLDWKVYARKDRYFVRQFEEDQSLRAYLVVDRSGSMAFQGAGPRPKWELACTVAAATAYLVMSQGDAAGLVTFGVRPDEFIPPRRQLTHLELMDAALARARPAGETDLAGVLREVAARIPRRSLVVIVSDLLGEPERIAEVVLALRTRKHEVFVLQILDPMERDLDLDGPVVFEGLEDGGTLRCEASLIRDAYRRAFERQMRLYQGTFRRAAIPYGVFYTDRPWERSLAEFLGVQAARLR